MSNTPFGFGSRPSNRLDPFFDDSFGFGPGPRRSSPLDPSYSDLSYTRFGIRGGSASAVVEDARVDWKETRAARVSKADLPGRRKRGVNVEVDASAVQISGQRACKREKKTDTRNRVEHEKTTETWHRVEREKTTETWHRVEREKKTETWHSLELEKKTDTRHHVAREKKTDTRQHAARGKKADSGEVLRRFRLPANVKADQVKVAMENRMLTVSVPKEVVKKPVKKPSSKSIKISDLHYPSGHCKSQASAAEASICGCRSHAEVQRNAGHCRNHCKGGRCHGTLERHRSRAASSMCLWRAANRVV